MDLFFLLATVVLIAQLAIISWADWKFMIIPNSLNLWLAFTGVGASYFISAIPLWPSLLKMAFVYAFFWLLAALYQTVRGQRGLGGGDIKFLAAASAWVELQALPWLVLVASVLGLAMALVAKWRGAALSADQRFPFGPYLAIGLLVVWLGANKLGV